MRRAEPKLTRPGAPKAEGRRPVSWLSPKRPGLRGRAILAAILAHLIFTVVVFLELDPRAPRQGALEVEEQGFDIVFNSAAPPGAPVEIPPSAPPVPVEAPQVQPAPPAPPAPPATPQAVAPPPPPEPPRPPQPAAPQAPPRPTPPPPPRPLAEAPAPPPPPPPPQMAEAPRPTPPPPPRPLAEAPAPPPPPPPQVAEAPRPTPPPPPAVARQRAEPPRLNVEPRPPLDLSHLPPVRLGQQDYRPRNRLDFTLGPVPNAMLGTPNVQIRGADDVDDWRREFDRWWALNARYPRDAIDFREQGRVGVRVFLSPDGTVRRVELRTQSRSITLNHYSQSVFRGAKLPPFKRPTSNEIELDFLIDYRLIRR